MLLQFCALGVTMSWDDGFLGARASRPHQAWHSLGHLPHLDQPGTAPWLSFGLADGVLAHRVAACSIALKLSGGQRDSMRAGRPRSQAMPSRPCGRGCLAGDFSESRPVAFGKLPFAREPGPHLPGGSFENETGFVSDKWRVPGARRRPMTWLHFLNDCTEINKMLNASIKSLSTGH